MATLWVETEKYLRSLPQGLRSFPECTTKAEVTLSMLAEFPAILAATDAPAELIDALRRLHDPEEYVPDALGMAGRYMVIDLMKSEDQFVAWHYALAKRIFLRPIYRTLMYVMSPSLALTNSAKRWGAFRRGTRLESKVTKQHAQLTLHFPPGLYPPVIQRALSASFRAAVEAAGGRDVHADVDTHAPGVATYVMRWR